MGFRLNFHMRFGTRVGTRFGIALAVLTALLLGASATSASADIITPPGSGALSSSHGYTVSVSFTGTGLGSGGAGGGYSHSMPATCWWQPASLDATGGDPSNPDDLMKFWLHDQALNPEAWFQYGVRLPSQEQWMATIARIRAGDKLTAYSPTCGDDPGNCSDTLIAKDLGRDGLATCDMVPWMVFFPTGAAPTPVVSPEQLAIMAANELTIPDPQVSRNPEIRAVGDATLVTIPTWFWVNNPKAVGFGGGSLAVTATAGPNTATVTATTGGLTVAAPDAGSTTCAPGAAIVKGPSCFLVFNRASVGYPAGYPVRASTAWGATWTGHGVTASGAPVVGSGDPAILPPIADPASVVNVPVAESQALVNGSR